MASSVPTTTITAVSSSSGFPLKTTTITTTTVITSEVSTEPTFFSVGAGGLPRFFVDEDPPLDHYYRKPVYGGGDEVPEMISREWHRLDAGLPDSISVRVYRSRPFLLRAAIVGGSNSPYRNHLFFLDVRLPLKFPTYPPRVHFCFPSFRVNPNLLDSGRVRLKIINTWFGASWKSDTTILQVLLKIEELLKDSNPFFVEPGLKGRVQDPSWEKVGRRYTEKVYVQSCSLTLNVLQKPPADFKEMVIAHYREHAVAILTDLRRYSQEDIGATVTVCGGLELEVTAGFKGVVQYLYGRLLEFLYTEYVYNTEHRESLMDFMYEGTRIAGII